MAFSLRPKSDALGLYGARIEWIAQVSTCDREVFERKFLPKQGILDPQGLPPT